MTTTITKTDQEVAAAEREVLEFVLARVPDNYRHESMGGVSTGGYPRLLCEKVRTLRMLQMRRSSERLNETPLQITVGGITFGKRDGSAFTAAELEAPGVQKAA